MAKVAIRRPMMPVSKPLLFSGGVDGGSIGGGLKSSRVMKRKTPSELRGEQLKRKNVIEIMDESPAPELGSMCLRRCKTCFIEDAKEILSVKTESHYQEELVTKIEDMKLEKGSIVVFNCSFFFVDGQFRLLEALTGGLKIPSLVIIDPLPHQHYVYPAETDFSYSSLSGFLQMSLNGSILPFQRSKSVFPNSKEAPRPPFVNQDFHEVDYVPHVNALTIMELVVGNYSGSFGSDNAWKKDVLVLFTGSWCGSCLRTELVVREVYRTFKGYGNMVKSQFRNAQSSSRNDGIINTILKLPMNYMMDCIANDCSSILKSVTKLARSVNNSSLHKH